MKSKISVRQQFHSVVQMLRSQQGIEMVKTHSVKFAGSKEVTDETVCAGSSCCPPSSIAIRLLVKIKTQWNVC